MNALQPIIAPPLPVGLGDARVLLDFIKDQKRIAAAVAELDAAHAKAEAAVKAFRDLKAEGQRLADAEAAVALERDALAADRRELARQLASVQAIESQHGDLTTRAAALDRRESALVAREAEVADGLRRISRFNSAYREAAQ